MPQVKSVKKKIWEIEGFEVNIKHNNKNLRSDKKIETQYQGIRMTRNTFSVSGWKKKFKTQFPGYDIDVLKNGGNKASGQMKLSTVRDTYLQHLDD